MTDTHTIGNVELNAATSFQLIIPLTGHNVDELTAQCKAINTAEPDLVEWRIDYLSLKQEEIVTLGRTLCQQLGQTPIIATIRTQTEGGQFNQTASQYVTIYQSLMTERLVDAIDIEFSQSRDVIDQLMRDAKTANVTTILSHHDFKQTPDEWALNTLMTAMANINPDVVKLALMPNSTADVLRLMTVTNRLSTHTDAALLTIAMGALGKLTRVFGDTFGSVASFVTASGQQSAPGQLDIETVRQLRTLYTTK